MGLLKKITKGIGKGVKNAAKWTGKNAKTIGKVAAIGAGTVLTGGAALGAIAPGLGATLAGKLGSGVVGNIANKVVRGGILLNKKIKNTLGKNNLPDDPMSTQELSNYIKENVENQGLQALEISDIENNYQIPGKLSSLIPSLANQANQLFGKQQTQQAGIGSQIANALQAIVPKKAEVASQQNEGFFEKFLMLKQMDNQPQQQPQEKESFLEKIMMLKELNKADEPQINPQTQAQQIAFNQLQNELQQSKFQAMLDSVKSDPKKMLLTAGLPIIMLLVLIPLMLNRKN